MYRIEADNAITWYHSLSRFRSTRCRRARKLVHVQPFPSNHLVFRHLGIMTSLNVGSDCLPVLAKCSQGKCPYSCKKPLKISEVENPKIRFHISLEHMELIKQWISDNNRLDNFEGTFAGNGEMRIWVVQIKHRGWISPRVCTCACSFVLLYIVLCANSLIIFKRPVI